MMTRIKKCRLPISLLISILYSASCFGQQKSTYSVFKLENEIGTEEVLYTNLEDNPGYHIQILTQDRGKAMKLAADYTSSKLGIRLISKGATSRYKNEDLDTLIAANGGFPLGKNGSIKSRELLITMWLNAGKPKLLRSAIDGINLGITELDQVKTETGIKGLRAFIISNGLDEIFWMDEEGKSVFLTYTDTEGDKREVIASAHLSDFNVLNRQSTQYLLKAYQAESKALAKPCETIAILGGTVIDIAHDGELTKNTLVVVKNGKIDYVGPMDKSLVPPEAELVNAADKFLIPGLWDMHAHIFHPSYLTKELLSGVTTVRDMGNEFDVVVQLKALLDKRLIPAPQLFAAGLLDGKSTDALGVMLASNATEAKTNVKKYHDAGFSQIKVYSNVKKNNFNTVVAAAKQYNMQVVGHLPTGYTVGTFINNGMNSISHMHYFMNSIKWAAGDLKANNKVLLDQLIAHHTFIDPTLNIYRLVGDKKIVYYDKLVKLFADYGIPIVAGTDNEGTVAEEVQHYVEIGLSPLNAIKAATVVPAQIMGAGQESGSIEKGKKGDLLIMDHNPLLDISALNRINTIINGRFVIRRL